jgi:hypothetical protein
MTTHTLVATETLSTSPQETRIDFATRLELSGVAVDAVGGAELDEAHDAASEALAEASRYLETPKPCEALTRASSPVLGRAREVLLTRGWAQGVFEAEDGAVCVLGAIREAAGGDAQESARAADELLTRIAASGLDGLSVTGWNDRPSTRRDDVLRLLY